MAYRPSPELDNLIDKLLGAEKHQFFESIGEALPHTIRFNPLKGEVDILKGFLQEQGFQFEVFPGFQNIYRLNYQPIPIGKSLSHFLGHFYVQDLASMLPPIVLDPQPGEIVLDMSAAPGSKTTQMAVMMKNKGMILANDVVQKRLRSLINNLQRMGILNTAVVKNYGESFGNNYFETFDKILLDPACSGLGTLHKSPEVLSWWTPNHCTRLAANQKQLISSAIKALKPGGTLVYSTCTLTPYENEEVIFHALSQFPVEIIDIHLPPLKTRPGLTEFDGKKYSKHLERTKRLYPFENQTEGFFIAKLQKLESMQRITSKKDRASVKTNFITDKTSPVKKYLDYFAKHFGIERKKFSTLRYRIDKTITVVTPELAEFEFKSMPLKTGLTIGRPMSHAGRLTTEGTHFLGNNCTQNIIELPDLISLEKFVNRQELDLPCEGQAQQIVRYQGITMGYGLSDKGKLKSQFPKAEWPFCLSVSRLE